MLVFLFRKFSCMVFVTYSQCVHDGCCTFTFSADAFVTILALWAYMMVVVLFTLTVCTEGILSHAPTAGMWCWLLRWVPACVCRNSSSSEPRHNTESPKGVPWQRTSQSTQDPDNFCMAVAAGCPWLYALTPEQKPLLWWHVHLDKVFFFACCCHICLRSVGIMEVHSWRTFNPRVIHHGKQPLRL